MNSEKIGYLEKFGDLHQIGIREFGVNWMIANQRCAEVGAEFLNIADPKIRYFLSLIAFRILKSLYCQPKTITV